ncbi:unnamed protein product [Blepharisma stoltei]|uniref:Uncharacterized protein n=1 Tax=Blepharisma stoltei TaxID=1481888 RepID=A0AAU9IY67_9CILI|nr:unnamed protein product [Blepharisma stoltei]
MKHSFPSLKMTGNNTMVSIPMPSRVHKRSSSQFYSETTQNSTINSKDFDLAKSSELSFTNSLHYSSTRKGSDTLLVAEFQRLDKELEIKEVELEGLRHLNSSQQYLCEKEYEIYRWYLEELALSLLHKDKGISNRIIKGITGFLKVAKKSFSAKPIEESQPKKRHKENSSQTEEIDDKEEIRFCSTPELNFIRDLSGKLQNVRFSKITKKLCDLYDSICKMHTEVPISPTELPDGYDFDEYKAAKLLEANIHDFHSKLTVTFSKGQPKQNANGNDKETQTDTADRKESKKGKDPLLQDKEIDTELLKQKYNHLISENKRLEDVINKMKHNLQDIEKKFNDNEFEAFQAKNKQTAIEEELKASKERNSLLSNKLIDKDKVLKAMRAEINDFKVKLIGKRNKLSSLRDNLFQTTVHLRIAEEKLKQIEDSWQKKFGGPYHFLEIDANEIIKKYKIFKIGQSDEEIDAKASEIEAPDWDSGDIDFSDLRKMNEGYRKTSQNYPKASRATRYKGNAPSARAENEGKEPGEGKKEDVEASNRRKVPNGQKGKYNGNLGILQNESEEEEEDEREENRSKNDARSRENSKQERRVVYDNISAKSQGIGLKSAGNSEGQKAAESANDTIESQRGVLQSKDKGRNVSQSAIQTHLSKTEFSNSIRNEETVQDSEIESEIDDFPQAQALRKQEKELIANLNDLEKKFLDSLSYDQQILYKAYKESLDHFKLAQKLSNIKIFSKYTQFNLSEFSLSSPQSRKARETSSSPSKIRRSRLEGDTIIGPTMVVIHRPTLSENFSREYEGLIGNDQIKLPPLVISIFSSEAEAQNLSPRVKSELIKCFEGHDERKCETECIHLKRAMMIRQKCRGVPYPLKKTLINDLN